MNHMKMLMAALVVLTVACGQEEGRRVELGQDTTPPSQRRDSWSPELTAAVDSGNAAYAAGEYETAAEIFRSLTEEHGDIGTVWFGLYMAEHALGNTEAAATALERAEAINPGLAQMHEAAQSGEMPAMPAGHPPLDSVDPQDAPPLTVDHDTGGSQN